jgi:hypothetical protein
MRELTAEDTLLISGGFLASQPVNEGGGTNTFGANPYQSGTGADQRNQWQRDADATAARLRQACSFLANLTGCSRRVDLDNYRNQLAAYNTCRLEGGQPGPSDCGRVPTMR